MSIAEKFQEIWKVAEELAEKETKESEIAGRLESNRIEYKTKRKDRHIAIMTTMLANELD